MKRLLLSFMLLALLLTACASQTPLPSATLPPPPTVTFTPAVPPLPTPPPATATPTPAPSATPTAVPLPKTPAGLNQPIPQVGQVISPGNTAELVELARWGSGRAENVTWSPDGAWLAVHTPTGAYLYDAAKPAAAFYIEGALTFSPDGKLAAAVQGQGNAQRVTVYRLSGAAAEPTLLYTLNAGRPLFSPDGSALALSAPEATWLVEANTGRQKLALEHKNVEQMLFSKDGAVLVTGGRDSLALWRVADGSLIQRQEYNRLVRLAFSAGGSLLLAQNRNKQNEPVVDLWSTADWKRQGTIKTGGTFSLSADASRLFAFSNFPTPGKIDVFQLPEGTTLPGLRIEGSIHRMTVSPDGKMLAISVPDPEMGVVRLVDLATGKVRLTLACEHSCDAQQPYYSPDGKVLALYGHAPMTGGDVAVAVLYDAVSGRLLRKLVSPRDVKSVVERLAFSADGTRLAVLTGRSDDAVRVWEVNTGKLLHTLEWAPQTQNLGALSPDGKLAVIFSDNPTTRLIDLSSGKVLRQVEKAAATQFTAEGSLLAGAEYANFRADAIRLWKVSGGEVAATFGKQLRPPLVLSPAGDVGAVLAGFSVQLLRIPSGQFITALSASARPNVRLLNAAFSPDGKWLAAGDESGLVWTWQVENRKQTFILEGHKKEISALIFSADSQTLVSLAQDGGVRMWSVADGKLLRTVNAAELIAKLPGMEEATFGLAGGAALSPDGKLLAVGGILNPQQAPPGKAGVTLLVDAHSGQLVRLLRAGGARVLFSPDGKGLLTSGDGAVRVWGLLP